jgi:hypothetical protein
MRPTLAMTLVTHTKKTRDVVHGSGWTFYIKTFLRSVEKKGAVGKAWAHAFLHKQTEATFQTRIPISQSNPDTTLSWSSND